MTREEQETHITWNAADKTVTIDTADPAVIRKLDRLAAEHPEAYSVVKEDPRYGTKWFRTNARFIRFGKPASEAVKEAGRLRMARINSVG